MFFGDLRDAKTAYGPLINEAALRKVSEHCKAAIASGAELLTGGDIHEGLTFKPTVLFAPPADSAVWTEETFGPVTSIVSVDGLDEAIAVANRSEYGLSAGILSNDFRRAVAAARRIRCGAVHIGAHAHQCPERCQTADDLGTDTHRRVLPLTLTSPCADPNPGAHSFQSDAMAPIGGFGLSSLGRSGGKYSVEHFTELKWISMNTPA